MDRLKNLLSTLDKKDKNALMELLSTNGIYITFSDGAKISNCYHSNCYDIVSDRSLSKDFIMLLRDLGLLGYGQECYINEKPANGRFNYKIVNYVDSSD